MLKIPSWRIFHIREEDSNVEGCMTVKFGIIGNEKQRSAPSQVFDAILKNSPEQLKGFAPAEKCQPNPQSTPRAPSSARANQISMFVIFSMIVTIALTNER
ncbi:PREDICTED: uncharacterized protein LOC107329755 [Acropora digitifera]|uniref:uncharacterized protein LOC107329755 n=1 Tax=Acropora digitifera TaxID=70779 RepID=UPI00077AD771|nr:PREDICTED: uncharacterized protein LOC107329755 [Acropora digitifera]